MIFINRPTMTIRFGNTIDPTHRNRVRLSFSENIILPEITENHSDDIELPEIIIVDEAQGTSAQAPF